MKKYCILTQDGVLMKITARTVLITAVILIYITAILPIPADAASYSNYEKALDLKILGLLANQPENFDLGRTPARIEGAIMLVRLLGRENQAKQVKYTHPFTDVPEWADAYVGYLYQNGLTRGIGDSKFGSNELLSANQYATLVLRSLGYSDSLDFKYSQSLDKARQIGLLNETDAALLIKSSSFFRNDMVGMSYNALSVKLKASGLTLLDRLVTADKAVFKPAAKVLGLYTSDLMPDFGGISSYKPGVSEYGYIAKTEKDLFLMFRDAMLYSKTTVKIDVRGYSGSVIKDFTDIFNKASGIVTEITGVEGFISSWEYISNSNSFTLTLHYRYSKNVFEQKAENYKAAVNKARYAVASLIKSGMSEYDREKVLHDYIINNTRYDYDNYLKGTIPSESFDAYGCLVRGIAVCEGYSKAMKLLCDLSSLECMIVSGKSRSGSSWEGHAWNIVKIDGSNYHLDVTNDDPVSKSSGNILAYYYFNLPDSEMAITSTWDKTKYPECTSLKNNYYYKNRLIADSKNAFTKAVWDALEQHKTMIELKVSDYTEAGYSNLSDIVFKKNTVLGFNSLVNKEFGIIRIYNIKYP